MSKVNKKALFLLSFFVVVCLVITAILISRKGLSSRETIAGTVTSKFTDCVGGEEMDNNGIVSPIKEVSCDGGSTITIDHKDTFVTATGFVASGSYSVDVSSIKVGDRVRVHYLNDSDGYKSLNCNGCGVQRIK